MQWSSDSLYILCGMFKRGIIQVSTYFKFVEMFPITCTCTLLAFNFTDPSKHILLSFISLRSMAVLVQSAKKAGYHSVVCPTKLSCYAGYRKIVTKFIDI